MAKVIAFTAIKGGAGKSSLAIALAVEWFRRGLRVLLLDLDVQQRSAEGWRELADTFGVDAPEVRALGRTLADDEDFDDAAETEAIERIERELSAIERDEMDRYDVILIDTPGKVGRLPVTALAFADLALIPCGPAGIEVRTMSRSLAQVEQVRAKVPELDAAIVITRKQPRTVSARRARLSFDDVESVDVLDVELFWRLPFVNSHDAGQGPTTWDPTGEAAREVRLFTNEISARLGLPPGKAAKVRKRVRKAAPKPAKPAASSTVARA